MRAESFQAIIAEWYGLEYHGFTYILYDDTDPRGSVGNTVRVWLTLAPVKKTQV